MLAVAGAIGAQARVPAMVLMRAPLGERGSYLPTAINVVQCLGWTVFELLVIATAAAALSDELLGFEARWAWTIVFGAAALVMGLLGPIGVVRTVIRRVAVWVVPLAVAYLAWWALDGRRARGGVVDRPGEGGLSTWQGIDIVVGVTVSWIPLAADYTRFARSPRGAFWGTGIGYFVPDALLLGARRGHPPDARRRGRGGAAGRRRGRRAARAARPRRTDGRGDRRGVRERVLRRRLAPEPLPGARRSGSWSSLTTAVGTIGALVLALQSFQSFLFLLGSFFVPLFAVLLADWLAERTALRPRRRLRARAGPGRARLRLDRGLRRLPVALPDRARLVGRAGAAARPARVGYRRHAAELRRLVRARARRVGGNRAGRCGGRPRVSRIGLIGNLAVDRVGRRRAATGRRCLPRCARRRARSGPTSSSSRAAHRATARSC